MLLQIEDQVELEQPSESAKIASSSSTISARPIALSSSSSSSPFGRKQSYLIALTIMAVLLFILTIIPADMLERELGKLEQQVH